MTRIADGRGGGKRSAPPAGKRVSDYEARHQFHGFRIADLRAAFFRVADPGDWRAPWRADVDAFDVAKIAAAARYYHGDEPVVVRRQGRRVTMAGHGMQSMRR